jgi:hypothetical protein
MFNMPKNKYIYDPEALTAYQFPNEPRVTEECDRKGKRTGWRVEMEVEITKRDNRLIGNRWVDPVADFPTQQFAPHYNRDQVISYFHVNHDPRGVEISEQEYRAV